ncbi:MAG: glycosyltransferase family 9 protein, partial [Xanthobacteraceae bacterium]
MPTDDLRSRDFQNILLIKLSALGDVVHTFPLLNKLRRRYPKARIDWLVASDLAELLQTNPAIADVIEFPRDEWSTSWRWAPYASAARLIARLRAAQYDLVLDLQGQLRSAIFAFACGAPVRIGFDKPRDGVWKLLSRPIPDEAKKHAWQGAREGSWLAYTHHIAVPTLDLHPVERYLGVAPLLGLDGTADFSFPIPQEATIRIDALLDYYDIGKAKPLVVMAPGTNWDTKRWRRDGFAEVARHFQQKAFAVILIGSDGERALCEEIAKLAPGAVDLAGETTLSELTALIQRATI